MIKGVDISKWQGDVNFDQLKNAVQFVIIRSSYGTGYTDEKFARNRDEARRVGLPRGFYHYAYPTYNTGRAEAEWFLKVVGTPQDGELLVLDFEENYSDPVGWSLEFLNRVSELTGGYKPLLYINLALAKGKNWKPVIDRDYGLWLAQWDYNPDAPMNPNTPWPLLAMRQYANNGRVSGINGDVDMNVFYGNVELFKRYGFHAAAPAPTPTPAPTPPAEDPRDARIRELEAALEAEKNKPPVTVEKEVIKEVPRELTGAEKDKLIKDAPANFLAHSLIDKLIK